MTQAASRGVGNLLRDLPDARGGEVFETLLSRPGVRIERIVSLGQVTPVDSPYREPQDEWVLLVAGAARLAIDGQGERALAAGDFELIPAGIEHRVTWTDPAQATIWLAVHIG